MPEISQQRTLFVFIDESGNFDFTSSGTKHYVMAGLATFCPAETGKKMLSLKYSLLERDLDIASFHASEDKQIVRDAVFATISELNEAKAYVGWVKKIHCEIELQNDAAIHALISKKLLEDVLLDTATASYEQIVVIFDQAISRKHQAAFHKSIKPLLKQTGKLFKLYFQRIGTDPNGQIADYLAWSKYVMLEREEFRPWRSVTRGIEIRELDFENYQQ